MTYLRDALTERVGEFIQLRRDIHRHPELAFEEYRTSDLVATKLESWGYSVHRGLGGTGVVGTLKRGNQSIAVLASGPIWTLCRSKKPLAMRGLAANLA